MEYTTLRGTGATVSRVTLGTMTFGDQVDERDAIRMVDVALDAGVNVVDTADVYTGGRSEEIVGKALRGRRDQVVLASKVCNAVGEGPKERGLHRWHVIRGVEASLRRLGTECLDICYLHRPDRDTPIEETLAAFDDLVRQGKVMYVGMSNYAAWQVAHAKWLADGHHWASPTVIQVPYNLLARGIEEECVEFALELDVGVAVYNPLAGGLLTGKHAIDEGPRAGTRFALREDYHRRYWHPVNFDAAEKLAKIAADAGKGLAELALQWVMTQEVVDSVILGVSRIEQLESNLRLCEGRLDGETRARCDEVWSEVRGPHFRYNR